MPVLRILLRGAGCGAALKGRSAVQYCARGAWLLVMISISRPDVFRYYEWLTKGKDKLPHFMKHKDGKLMLMAGLYDCVTLEGKLVSVL